MVCVAPPVSAVGSNVGVSQVAAWTLFEALAVGGEEAGAAVVLPKVGRPGATQGLRAKVQAVFRRVHKGQVVHAGALTAASKKNIKKPTKSHSDKNKIEKRKEKKAEYVAY